VYPLRVAAFGMLFLTVYFLMERYRGAMAERQAEVALPDALPGTPDAPAAHTSRVA
jgi:heme exporter protein C